MRVITHTHTFLRTQWDQQLVLHSSWTFAKFFLRDGDCIDGSFMGEEAEALTEQFSCYDSGPLTDWLIETFRSCQCSSKNSIIITIKMLLSIVTKQLKFVWLFCETLKFSGSKVTFFVCDVRKSGTNHGLTIWFLYWDI